MNKTLLKIGVATLLLELLVSNVVTSQTDDLAEQRPVVNVVLFGSTGSLAAKYLWQAMFNLYLENELSKSGVTILFTAAGRDPPEKASEKVKDIIDQNIKCIEGTAGASICSEHEKIKFAAVTRYVRLKHAEDYKSLCSTWDNKFQKEIGRIMYLSIPPFAYSNIADLLNQHCKKDGTYLRVAIEKPFGSDLQSALEMAEELKTSLKDDQLYRVDHYLGKRGVQQIRDFRVANKKSYGDYWNAENIEEVNIIMKETEDVAGRTSFYDAYGVIRDVHQNHLTEVLSLVCMAMPKDESDSNAELLNKADLLSKMQHVRTVALQYDNYNKHVQEDTKNDTATSNTPTLAVTEVAINSADWKGVKVHIMAGKALNVREAEVRVVFRSDAPIISKTDQNPNSREIVFHIQGGNPSRGPYTFVGSALPAPVKPNEQWVDSPEPLAQGQTLDFGQGPDRPYDKLVWSLFQGDQANFVRTDGLVASWTLWDAVLQNVAEKLKSAPIGKYTAGLKLSFKDILNSESTSHDEF
eukprot:m.21245 g.21245  ORF g.21245 m.21245 type:complete len:523 (+) comp7091_c0_seq1:115-1683(+)